MGVRASTLGSFIHSYFAELLSWTQWLLEIFILSEVEVYLVVVLGEGKERGGEGEGKGKGMGDERDEGCSKDGRCICLN